MARLIVALIRHGDYAQLPDTPSAHQPFGLTEKGCKQAQEAAVEIEKLLHTKRSGKNVSQYLRHFLFPTRLFRIYHQQVW